MVKNIIFIILISFIVNAKDIRYFKSVIRYPGKVIFEVEMDKKFNIIVDSSLSSVIKDKKSLFKFYYKVYYENSKPSYAKLIEIKGDSYHIFGKVYRDKNVIETDTDIIIKFNKKGKEIYSNSSNSECNTSYGQNYKEVKCISKDNLAKISTSKSKRYFENGVLKKTIRYDNGKFSNYAIYSTYRDMKSIDYENILFYDKDGKYIDIELNVLEKFYKEAFLDDKRKILKSIINRKIEISNIPDLNLTLEQQYFDKIDKLNGR